MADERKVRFCVNDKKNFVILLVIMVVLIGGAFALYNVLGDKLDMPGLVVQDNAGAGNAESNEVPQNGSGASAGGTTQSGGEADGGTSQSGGEADGGTSQSAGTESDSTSNGGSNDTAGEEETKELAPDFTVYDAEGNAYKLSDFRGKPVIVNFWASWCGPCKSEMPDFQEVYEQYGEEIHFLMVNMTDGAQETVDSASEFIAESGYTFPIYYDTDMDAAITYGVYSIPTTYFFDAEGYGIAYGSGALDREIIQTGIDMIYNTAN